MMRNKLGVPIRFGVQIVAFNGTDYLEAVVRIFQPFVDKIVISTAEKSWMNNIENDGEVEKVATPLAREFDNVHFVKGDWKTEAEQRNVSLNEHLAECDYVFIVDDDELWDSGDIYNAKKFAIGHHGYTVFRAHWNTRFKNIDWRVEPREPFKPVVLVKKGIKFAENRSVEENVDTVSIIIPEDLVILEHLSYVRSEDSKIKDKIRSFSHANDIVGGVGHWYENVYLQADLDSKNIHPTHPECYASLIQDNIGLEIKRFLEKYSPLNK